MKPIDLRSDTVTRPGAAMRQAMATAEVGDDVLGDDPTVIELETYCADLFKFEAALFVPSGTMGNQVCLKTHTEPGWELLCERECHIVNYEVGAPALLSHLMINLLDSERGMLTADQIRANVRAIDIHCPRTRIVALENTHNRHGGTILPQSEIKQVREVCDEMGLILHLDGARIWNAHVATGIPLDKLVAPFDSVSVCLSKGLGAPVGSVILGGTDFIGKARRIRKLFGGAMRQVGILAAAGLWAIRNNLERLVEDHTNARLIAERLSALPVFDIDLSRVETNIVIADLTEDRIAEEVLRELYEAGVWAVPFGPRKIRFVTHLDVSREDCKEAVTRIEELYG
ncbi:MAG TPA: GntG family PLP-dependent aldolase [candidate division Zixibacteria bacterium]|nr:GntG family PLP-dependent aldolase [candidate division Zixibacteria bacterium]